MGNRHKGTVTRELDGVSYTFALSVNAFCAIEDATGETMTQMFRRLQSGMKTGEIGMKDLRLLFWAALLDHHPDIDLHGAGLLLSNVGGMAEQLAFVENVFNAAMPDDDKEQAGKTPGKKRAAARTGRRSSGPGSGRALTPKPSGGPRPVTSPCA